MLPKLLRIGYRGSVPGLTYDLLLNMLGILATGLIGKDAEFWIEKIEKTSENMQHSSKETMQHQTETEELPVKNAYLTVWHHLTTQQSQRNFDNNTWDSLGCCF